MAKAGKICAICGRPITRGGQKGTKGRWYHTKCLLAYANRYCR